MEKANKELETEGVKEAEKEPEKEDTREKETEQEGEKEQFVLKRKAKSTGEATVVENPPIILLTKKTLQEEGHMKDKPIEIEEDEEKAEEAAQRREDKGKEKVEEEGQEMVQHKADMSTLTPGGKGGGRRRK